MYPYSNPSIIAKGIEMIKNVKWGALLDGTGKTLGVINQAIPVVYQLKPIVSNAKTLLKIANVINTPDTKNDINQQLNQSIQKESTNNSPIFYL